MHDAQIALQDDAAPAQSAVVRKPNLMLRNDTILGVCQAIGDDFGFHPNILRIVLSLGIFWNPAYVIGGYLAAGLVIALTRWIFPDVVTVVAQPAEAAEPANSHEESLRLAA